jgi:hypothetical protein
VIERAIEPVARMVQAPTHSWPGNVEALHSERDRHNQ